MNNYSFALKNFNVTNEEHSKYKKLVSNILFEFYPDPITIDNFDWIPSQEFDNKGSDISIINKAIGNLTIINWMINTFDFKTFDELISFVENNKLSLFKTSGIYFNELHDILKISERKGIKNEKKAIKYIKLYLKSKSLKFKIKRTPLCSRQDVIEGIDIIITIDNKEWYVQVKPLKSYTIGDTYEIISSGKIKKYNIHYYIFVNEDECVFVSNRNLEVINGVVYVPKENLKSLN